MRKLITMILAMLLLSCAFAAAESTGFSAGEYDPGKHTDVQPLCIGDYRYIILSDGTAEIVGYSGHNTELMIPAKLKGLRVTSIGRSAFRDQAFITRADIPEGVTHIGDSAFYSCTAVADVILPDSLASIATLAFYHNQSLTHVALPDGLVRIGECAFNRCISLPSITIPASVTSIGRDAFGLTYEKEPCPILVLTPGSTAEQFAQDYGYRYFYSEGMTEAWTCPSCRNYNLADVCSECGAAMPEPQAASVDDGSWACTCGADNATNFCPDCGTARPDKPGCSGCGYRPEGEAPNFCPECGTAF